MKNKKIIRLFTAALAVALCATAFAVPAFAGGGEGEPYYTETAGTEADPAEDAEAPEVTITDEEDPAGDDSADNNTEVDGDTLDQITELLGGLGTVTVTEDGILFTPDTEKWETQQTGTVTTCGGNLNVRTGAGLDNDAFTQLPDGAQVEVIGTEGEWVKVLLPEREGYVHSDYLTITDTGSFSLSLDGTDLSALLGALGGGQASPPPAESPSTTLAGINPQALSLMARLGPLLSQANREDDATRLLRALRPLLGEARQKKVDEAIQILQMLRLLPLLKESGVFSGLLSGLL